MKKYIAIGSLSIGILLSGIVSAKEIKTSEVETMASRTYQCSQVRSHENGYLATHCISGDDATNNRNKYRDIFVTSWSKDSVPSGATPYYVANLARFTYPTSNTGVFIGSSDAGLQSASVILIQNSHS